MADDVRIEVSNLKQLKALLKKMEDKHFVDSLTQAHRQVSVLASNMVQRKAPIISGRLALSTRPKPLATAGRVSIGTPRGVPYAGPVIWGWSARNIKKNPYPLKALNAGRPELIRVYEENIREVIKKAGL